MDAAGREFERLGHATTSISSSCREAGVTTGALYHYFRSKKDLLDALVVDQSLQVAKVADESRAVSDSAFERLATFVVAAGRHLVQEPLWRMVARMATDASATEGIGVFMTWSVLAHDMLIGSNQDDIALTVGPALIGDVATGAVIGAWVTADRGSADKHAEVLDTLSTVFLLGVVEPEDRELAVEVLARVLER